MRAALRLIAILACLWASACAHFGIELTNSPRLPECQAGRSCR